MMVCRRGSLFMRPTKEGFHDPEHHGDHNDRQKSDQEAQEGERGSGRSIEDVDEEAANAEEQGEAS